jgi:hypothetical protein
MSEQTRHITSKDVRDAIVSRIELETEVTLGEVEDDVSRDLGIADVEVRAEFDELQQNGFVYHTAETFDRDSEVKTP